MRKKRRVLVVDGYNLLGANAKLFAESKISLQLAREEILKILTEYQAVQNYEIICVFDAYEVKSKEAVIDYYGLTVVYTKEKETADEYIFAYGAYRIPSREMWLNLEDADKNISAHIEAINEKLPRTKLDISDEVLAKMEKLRRGEK